MGKHVAAMHDGGLIHGDLTTSNILVTRRGGEGGDASPRVVLIDFGLASLLIVPEDKGVDLYVLERAITVTHAASRLFEAVMRGVQAEQREVERQLQQVRGGAHAPGGRDR